ncbi:MAG TPA: hypothetical protein VK463_06370 [Desulfomonilaceae bacterium]|nr:hypothetical protein [Desulfomonilaceae bacterium]
MNLRSALIIIAVLSMLLLVHVGPASCETVASLNVCQELVNSARNYEARATYHNQISKSLQMQIENFSKLPKTQSTALAIDQLFNQYDENRMLEQKFRDLYRQAADQAKSCMK